MGRIVGRVPAKVTKKKPVKKKSGKVITTKPKKAVEKTPEDIRMEAAEKAE